MRILHYTLGLPPFRSGGLTKYATDLMISQVKDNNQVFLLYPGHFNFFKKTCIKQNKNYSGVTIYEIVNPLPVPLLGGIKNISRFMDKVSKNIYVKFLKKISPDIIHIHTLMGLHYEMLEAAKDLNIKIIYTTHDYFGICPKVNLLDNSGDICENYNNGKKCGWCNTSAYSIKQIVVMQSLIYRKMKDNFFIRKLRKYKKDKYIVNKNRYDASADENSNDSNGYRKLRAYYLTMFGKVDYFHFNSSVAEIQYKKYFNCEGEVINITHSDINDVRQEKIFGSSKDKLRITYMGSENIYKGFYLLKNSLDLLVKDGITNFNLNLYGDNYKSIDDANYIYHNKYKYSDLEKIFFNTDLVIVPSISYETFCFIALEAYSYGVPIIMTKNVGFKDIISNYENGIVVDVNKEALANEVKKIIDNRDILKKINCNINLEEFIYKMDKHEKDILMLYKKVKKGDYIRD